MSKIMGRVMEVWRILRLIIVDVIRLFANCFLTTVIISICIENGWIVFGNLTEVSYEVFWNMFRTFSCVIPFVSFYRGLTGRYSVARIKIKIPYHKIITDKE